MRSYWTYILASKLPGVAPVPLLVPRGGLDPRDKPEDDTSAG